MHRNGSSQPKASQSARRMGSTLHAVALLGMLGVGLCGTARAEDPAAPVWHDTGSTVHTAWAASVRAALAARVTHAFKTGHNALAWSEKGIASWYGRKLRGHLTSSGARLNPDALTAAHPTLPLGSKVLVTSQDTGKSVIVTINDRGPYNHRIIDLSHAAAAQIGMLGAGIAHVKLAPLPEGTETATPVEVAEAGPDDTSDQAVSPAALGTQSAAPAHRDRRPSHAVSRHVTHHHAVKSHPHRRR
ncbi:septal ring lytic transglycosylase RlpA family protein [Acidomonas methanolica]|uniref:septal ring lytic transglycosylase RlpA family protein n=1 Tax=Acidomonas methanolica TaxID=437 RepID=UPI00211A2F0C